MIGSHFGTKMQLMVNERFLRYMLILVLIAVAWVMLRNGSKVLTPVIFTVLGLLFIRIVLELFGINI